MKEQKIILEKIYLNVDNVLDGINKTMEVM